MHLKLSKQISNKIFIFGLEGVIVSHDILFFNKMKREVDLMI